MYHSVSLGVITAVAIHKNHPINTYIQKNTQFPLRQIDTSPFLRLHAEKAVPVPLYCVWFSSAFGLAFLRFAIQLFVFGFLC